MHSWLRPHSYYVCAVAVVLSGCQGSGLQSGALPSEPAQPNLARAMRVIAPATTYTLVDLGPGPTAKYGGAYLDAANNSFQAGYYVYELLNHGARVYHAVAWTGPASTPVDITPPLINFAEAWVYGGKGNILVGYGITNNGGYFGYPHALVWRGSNLAWTDINPSGAQYSYAYAGTGTSIAGSASTPGGLHAMLWPTSNLKAPNDLNPAGYSSSEAYGVGGRLQVGYAVLTSTNQYHAILWRGSATSKVDLTPPSVSSAYVEATDGKTEVGGGSVSTSNHAMLWRGTAKSMIDLNPSVFVKSYGRGVLGNVQAGYAYISGQYYPHAIVWNGTAQSAVDLQLSLPSTYIGSEALGLDSKGDILGAAVYNDGRNPVAWHAIMWVP